MCSAKQWGAKHFQYNLLVGDGCSIGIGHYTVGLGINCWLFG